MRKLIVYSSKTGNTRCVAEAGAEAWGEDTVVAPMAGAPALDDFDLVALGFWIDKGKPNAEARRFLKNVRDRTVAFFFTLGADADSQHAMDCAADAEARLAANKVLGHFRCMGRIDPALIRRLERLPSWFPHGPNTERRARWTRAASHPDDDDLARARAAFAAWRKAAEG